MKLNDTILELLGGYKAYLRAKPMVEKNTVKYRNRVAHFISWTIEKGLNEIRYTEMMEYVRYCSATMKPANINRYLCSIRHFFDYLNRIDHPYLNPVSNFNPAKDIQIKGVFRTIQSDYLKEDELEQLYKQYQGKDKIMLGLFVYQGLKVGEIERLEKVHFDLQNGKVYVPAVGRSNSRTLKLVASQMYDLMTHINTLKSPSLLGKPLQNYAQRLCKALRLINPKVRNSSHLRGSRISYWIRNYNIREVQYLAGHKTIAGTEMYRLVNLEDLQNQVSKFHPLQESMSNKNEIKRS